MGFWGVWDLDTGKLVHREDKLPGYFVRLALSPDAKAVAQAMQRAGENLYERVEVTTLSAQACAERCDALGRRPGRAARHALGVG